MKTKTLSIAVVLTLFPLGLLLGAFALIPRPEVPLTADRDTSLSRRNINGLWFHTETFGSQEGEAVVVLHGGPGGDYRSILPLAALADDGYQVIFFDQRGSGLTQRVPDQEISMDHVIRDLDAFVELYGGRVHIIGHSWGAMYATAYTGHHPEKVQSLVLAEPGFLTPEMATRYMDATGGLAPPISWPLIVHATKTVLRSLRVENGDGHARSDWFAASLMTGEDIPGHPIAGYFKDGDVANGDLTMWRQGSRFARILMSSAQDDTGNFTYDFSQGVDQWTGEALFIAGEFNVISGEHHQRLQMGVFPKARLEVIPNAGHTMFSEQSALCLNLIRDYLAENAINGG